MVDDIKFPGKYSRLVLSGGGPRGLALLGALHYVDEHHGLDDIREIWGTSIGSLIGLLLIIGYTPFEAFHQFFMLEHFADPSTFDLQSILETSALCPIEIFGDKVRHFIEKKLGKGADPTFFDIYQQFGKKIHILGSNVDTMRGECFDIDTQPLMKVTEAIEISCDLPYIFTKKEFNGHHYVDGGFINNYPVNLADDGQEYCLGICVHGDTTVSGSDYIGWIYRYLQMPIMELHRVRIERLSEKFTNVELNIDKISMVEMSPNSKKKIEVFSAGYQQARDVIRKLCTDRLKDTDPDPIPGKGWGLDDWEIKEESSEGDSVGDAMENWEEFLNN